MRFREQPENNASGNPQLQKGINSQSTVTGVGGRVKWSRAKIRISVGLLILILAMFIAGLVYSRNEANYNLCKSEKTSPLYDEAQVSMSKLLNNEDLDKTVNKIKKQKSFEKDTNCLYPIVVHAIRTNNLDEAEKYYEKLQMNFDDNIGFAKVYGETAGRQTVKSLAVPIADLRMSRERGGVDAFPSIQ